jgi:hypothetical protein
VLIRLLLVLLLVKVSQSLAYNAGSRVVKFSVAIVTVQFPFSIKVPAAGLNVAFFSKSLVWIKRRVSFCQFGSMSWMVFRKNEILDLLFSISSFRIFLLALPFEKVHRLVLNAQRLPRHLSHGRGGAGIVQNLSYEGQISRRVPSNDGLEMGATCFRDRTGKNHDSMASSNFNSLVGLPPAVDI